MSKPQEYIRKATDEVFLIERIGSGKYRRTDTGQEMNVIQLNKYYEWKGTGVNKALCAYTTSPNGFKIRVRKQK
jgi:hypothetical protein